ETDLSSAMSEDPQSVLQLFEFCTSLRPPQSALFRIDSRKKAISHEPIIFKSSGPARSTHSHRQSTAFQQLFTPKPKAPIRLEELKAADCQPAGGVLVNESFIHYVRGPFFALPPEPGYHPELCVQKAEQSFELKCKREFRTSEDAPSESRVDVSAAIQELGDPDGNIILQAQYLRQRVTNEFQRTGVQVMFLDDVHGKAASDGSIIWFVMPGVVGRTARMSFDLQVVALYSPALSSHRVREQVLLPSGQYRVRGKWDMIVEKVRWCFGIIVTDKYSRWLARWIM
ncbi:hypothetical protein FRC06_007381, partial [Ceratobasidium sp. 370]